MSKTQRLSEKWFRRGLWLVAVIFASFLIGLGGTLVGDLPKVETPLALEDFMNAGQLAQLNGEIKRLQQAQDEAEDALAQAQLQYQKVGNEVQSERASFQNWLSTRTATASNDHDAQVLERTRKLDQLQQLKRQKQQALEAEQQKLLDNRQAMQKTQEQLDQLRSEAREQFRHARQRVEMRVFLYRLALTLPLLLIAAWLFVKQRKSTWWPFVWGFIGFALFTFFVELVPYLPSFGGYVRYGVGVLVTVVVGRWVILALNRYLEQQKQAESLPEQQRRVGLSYDAAQARLAKSVCPGCERAVNLKNDLLNFCPHCGMGFQVACITCGARKSAFERYCFVCGVDQGGD